jgi:hypothetical protein
MKKQEIKRIKRELELKRKIEKKERIIKELKRKKAENISQIKGLLGKFIMNKLSSYVEPSRKGTPKGEPIGFGRTKYEASLYMLLNLGLKDVANDLHISYGLLKKWRTEPEFKIMVFDHIIEFTEIFVRQLREIYQNDCAFVDKHLREATLEELGTGELDYPTIEEFADLNTYSFPLRVAICTHLCDLITGGKDFTLFAWSINLTTFFRTHPTIGEKVHKENALLVEKTQDLKKRMANSLLTEVIEILNKTDISETERRQAIYTLALIRKLEFS